MVNMVKKEAVARDKYSLIVAEFRRFLKAISFLLILSILFISYLFVSQSYAQKEKEAIKNLAPAYREWLEIVTPIITDTEKEVFLKLKTDQERDRFINFFWKIRDPNPDTAENEFYRDYLERVHFADQYFSIGSSKRGCLSERGYYYLLLGKPLERQIFATQSNIWPMELWFYKGDGKYGLPGYFYMLFYQPQGIGDYRLYYPGVEGPENLVIPSLSTEQLTRDRALNIIKGINTELAKAAISYLPEDRADTLSSFSSQSIIAAIKSLPEKKFSTEYARNYLSYKDFIEVDYSHNYVTSSAVAKVIKNGDNYFIHWSIEPDKVNFAESEGIYSAIFELTIRLEDFNGNPVFARTEEIPLRLNREQFEAHARQRFAFQDLFPVLPGSYQLLFLLKNKTAKDFTSYETNIIIPEGPSAEPLLSQLFLYHLATPSSDNKIKAFSVNGQEFLVSARNEFSPAEKLSVYCQLLNPKTLSDNTVVQLCLKSLDSPEVTNCQKKLLKEVLSADKEIRFEPIGLNQFKPGYYQVELLLLENDKIKARQKDNFILLAQPALTTPWVYSRVHKAATSVEFYKDLASQNFLKGNYQEARRLLENILTVEDEPESRLLMARILFALNNYKDSLTYATSVYKSTGNREAAKVIALDYAKLQDWKSSLVYLEKLMAEATEVSVLNLAAEAYIHIGEKEKAISLLEKSLGLLPDQPNIKSWLEDLKKNKNG
ncbi:MAG: GWxTD domain-containing protein [Candidatus Saccharicenans sp.]